MSQNDRLGLLVVLCLEIGIAGYLNKLKTDNLDVDHEIELKPDKRFCLFQVTAAGFPGSSPPFQLYSSLPAFNNEMM